MTIYDTIWDACYAARNAAISHKSDIVIDNDFSNGLLGWKCVNSGESFHIGLSSKIENRNIFIPDMNYNYVYRPDMRDYYGYDIMRKIAEDLANLAGYRSGQIELAKILSYSSPEHEINKVLSEIDKIGNLKAFW